MDEPDPSPGSPGGASAGMTGGAGRASSWPPPSHVSTSESSADPRDPRDPLTRRPGGRWFILHTRSRNEKALAADLRRMEIPHFLPLIRQERVYSGRRTTVTVPMFPGYLFLHGTLDDAYAGDRTRRVARIVQVNDQARLDWELRNLALALEHHAPLDPYPFLKQGTRVEVKSGPFRGLQGMIEGRSGERLILEVEMLGQAVMLELHGALLDRLD